MYERYGVLGVTGTLLPPASFWSGVVNTGAWAVFGWWLSGGGVSLVMVVGLRLIMDGDG